jgi:hypothetical protein
MTDGSDIAQLIHLGEMGNPGIPPGFTNPEVAWRKVVCGPELWDRLGRTLSESDLRNLIRGLVLLSQATRRHGGSVSPVIALYFAYVERFPERELPLTRWIIQHRINAYEPYGSAAYSDATSLADFYVTRSRRQERARRNEEAERLRSHERHLQKRQREAVAATERLPNAVRRGDLKAVEALLQKGADWRAASDRCGGLLALARKEGRTSVEALLIARGIM